MHTRTCTNIHAHIRIHGLSFSKKKYTNVYRAFLLLIFNKLIYCRYSNFKIQAASRCAQPFICLQVPAIWNDQCFTSTRRARSKFNQTSKRLPAPAETRSRIAIRGFGTNFRFYIAFHLTPSLSLSPPSPPFLFFLSPVCSASHSPHSLRVTFSVSSLVEPIVRELRDSTGREDRLSGNWIPFRIRRESF